MSSNICFSTTENVAVCPICPRACRLAEGQIGNCRSRRNENGKIVPLAYNAPCSVALDPMEKKPLFHFFPGQAVLSLGMAGCNLHCKNCQNASISQVSPLDIPSQNVTPQMLVEWLQKNNVQAVAYTYTEPLVSYEYVLDCAKAIHEAGFKNVLVSAGYINPKPLAELLPYLDAANIDLKSMSESKYWENSGIHLQPVLNSLKMFAKANVVLEVTNLVIPDFNDTEQDFQDWCKFIAQDLGVDIPVHFSRFFPQYQMTDRPPTPETTLHLAAKIAKEHGLKYVYCGNTAEDEITVCPHCGTPLIVRKGYQITKNIIKNGCCPQCGTAIYGRF